MPAATLTEIGDNIAERRRDQRIKQAALAADAGMSQANLSRIERGEQEADEYQLRKFATVLKCTIADLKRPRAATMRAPTFVSV
jgi:transcriptional regulator with XRE-family HTH domain